MRKPDYQSQHHIERIRAYIFLSSTLLVSFEYNLHVLQAVICNFSNKQRWQIATSHIRTVGRVYAGWGLSQAYYREELYRDMGFDSLEDFVAGFWEDSFMKMNPHEVLAMLWTGQYADISKNLVYNGDFAKALESIEALACVMPGSTDLFCPAKDNEYVSKLMPNATFNPINSVWGHFSGRGMNSIDNKFINRKLKQLLNTDR